MNNVVKIKPLKLTIDAQYSGNEDVNSDSFSFSGVAYSGGLVQNHSGFGSLIIDTANLKIEKEQTPIYFNHSSDSIIGFSEISVENNQIVLNGIISKNLDEGKRVQELNKLGFKWELSVGIAPTEISYAREGEIINGVTLTKDVAIFQKNTLFEVSIVDIGADRNTETKFFSKEREAIILNGEETMNTIITEENKELFTFACNACKGTVSEIETELQDKEIALSKLSSEASEKDTKIAELESKIAELEAEKENKNIADTSASIVSELKASHIVVDSSVIELLLRNNMDKESIVGKFSVNKEVTTVKNDYLTTPTELKKEDTLEFSSEELSAMSGEERVAFISEFAKKKGISFVEANNLIFTSN